MLRIRRMRIGDIWFAIKLSDQEKWGTTRQDFERLLWLDPHGSFVAEVNGKRVGLTTTTSYGRKLAWIGNVIVDRRHRGQRIGRQLVDHASSYLQDSRISTIALYCFKENVRFYRNLGFVKDAKFVRLRRPTPKSSSKIDLRFGRSPALSKIFEVDRAAFGADRSRLIRRVIDQRAGWYVGLGDRPSSTSYVMGRDYSDTCEFGPWVSQTENVDENKLLLYLGLLRAGRKPAEIACLARNRAAVAIVKSAGFKATRIGYRMFHKRRVKLGSDASQFGLGFQDKG